MSWELYVKSAESILESKRVPPCQEIISFIKRINPTSLQLSETDRERGYLLKNRLQNLLLENYGETFHLAPHPYNPDIILIKHNALPSIDACHADLNALSLTALDRVSELAKATPETPGSEAKAKPRQAATGSTAKEILDDAELLLAQYDYPQAEEMLASLRIADARDLPTLLKAVRLLVEEMGAYGSAIEVLLAQPRQVLKDKAVRELLALTYHGNGMIPEARALFDASHPGELGKGALYAYADISFKDGNLSQAYHLLRLSEEKEGFVTAHASLRNEIEAALLEEARPFLSEAEAAIARGDEARAESLLGQALSLYPGFQRARQLASEIEARKTGAELEMLWERVESSGTAAERLDHLALLLERDKENSEKIRKLMTRERWRQKQDALEDRLRALRTLAAEEKWEECFDAVLWLSRQGGEAYYRQACEVSPYFSVLHQNKRLQRLSDEEAKGLWLGFVSLKRLVRQGQLEGCWSLAQDLKQYFRSDPLFKEDYDKILELERDKARQEIDLLRDRLVELQEDEELEDLEEPERSEKIRENFAEAKQIFADMRRWLVLLPADERAESQSAAERILDWLAPDADDGSYEDYRDALLLGHSVRAGRIRETYCHTWVKAWFEKVDAEIAEKFAIFAEPIPLTVSPDLVVDLGTEPVSPGPKYLTSSERHLVYGEDDETLIVIDTWRMSATRYRSPHFKDLEISDIDPDANIFLFANTATNNTVWRATLSETESRFTAVFNINEHFIYREASFEGMFLCCGKENAYYAFIKEGDSFRVVKQNIDLVSSVVRTYEVKGEVTDLFRLSFRPDRFVICTESSTIVLESNLTPTRDCSRAGAGQKLYPLGVDTRRSQIFAVGDDRVNVVNSRLRAVKQLKRRETLSHIILQSMARICVDNLTLVLSLDQTSTFYNMETDQFSQKFLHHRVMNTATPSRWYYGEFDMTKPAVKIRDITDELTTLLKWEVMCHEVPGDDSGEIAGEELLRKLNDPDYFSIIRPADRSPGDAIVP